MRLLAAFALAASVASAADAAPRPFALAEQGPWMAIAYGPHRDGQSPNGAQPTRAQITEDVRLLAPRWRVLRTYNSTGAADSLFPALAAMRRPPQVVLGVWIAPEDRRDSTGAIVERFPAARAANRREVDAAVRWARRYPHLVAALSVGNETQVFWSANRVAPDILIGYLRELHRRTRLPLTTSDDVLYWITPESRRISRELDFVSLHLHPLWAGQSLERAAAWVEDRYDSVRAVHPGIPVIIGETGWATDKRAEGEQATLMKGTPGEAEQARFVREAEAFAIRRHAFTILFEAFDENWKGSADPRDAEKHWGVFRADRTPKAAWTARP